VADDRTITLPGDAPRPGELERSARPGLLVLFSEGKVASSGLYAALPRISIGRQPDQHVSIDDAGLSRQHAVISFDSSGVRLTDLGSHNGSYVDGARVSGEAALRFGAVIRCGATLLTPVRDIAAFRDWPASARAQSFIGGPEVQALLRAVELLAPRPVEVLVTGESGTGKELLVRLLHERSRRQGPLVAINCAAMPEPLFEAELFGVRKGAFTGASSDRPGLIAESAGGTFFLDEIGEMPLGVQPKLLRTVELRQVRAVGGQKDVPIDVRFVAATNRDLASRAEQGLFRDDLFHRLCGASLHIPPLRERRHDIIPLALHLHEEASASQPETPPLSTDFVEALLLQPWPGNVRELRRSLQQALFSAAMEGSRQLRRSHVEPARPEQDEQVAKVRKALERAHGNVAEAATELGMSRASLYRTLSALGIKPQDFRR
jgi:DNA-binding NtrC family response regulator